MTNITQPKQPGGLKAYTARWNELVTEANKLGGFPGVKVHTSDFESYPKAEKRVAWLEAQIEAKRPAVVEATPVVVETKAERKETKAERLARKARKARKAREARAAKKAA
jgi:hypothetical protein